MFKNWKEICAEPDPALRLLLVTATETRVLEGLQKGFPQYFAEQETPLRVPLSAIKAWRDVTRKADPNFAFPEKVLAHYGIPQFTFGPDQEFPAYPDGIRELLGKKNIAINGEAGVGACEEIHFVWRGKPFVVADYVPDDDAPLILVPEGFIDFNA